MSSLSEHYFVFICKALSKKIGALFDLIKIMEKGSYSMLVSIVFSVDLFLMLFAKCVYVTEDWFKTGFVVQGLIWIS